MVQIAFGFSRFSVADSLLTVYLSMAQHYVRQPTSMETVTVEIADA